MATAQPSGRIKDEASGSSFSRTGMFPNRIDDPTISLSQRARGSQILARLNRQFPPITPTTVRRLSFAADPLRPITSALIAEELEGHTVSVVSTDRRSRDHHLRNLTAQTEIALRQERVKNELAAYLAAHPIPDLVDHALQILWQRKEALGETPEAIAEARAALEKANNNNAQMLTPAEKTIAEQFLALQHECERSWWDRDTDSGSSKYYGDEAKSDAWSSWSNFYKGPEISFGDQKYKTRDVFEAVYKAKTDFAREPEKAAMAAAAGIVASGLPPKDYKRATQEFMTKKLSEPGVTVDKHNLEGAYKEKLINNCLDNQANAKASDACLANVPKDLEKGMSVLDKIKREKMLDKAEPAKPAHEADKPAAKTSAPIPMS
jgi:hypothetical protein